MICNYIKHKQFYKDPFFIFHEYQFGLKNGYRDEMYRKLFIDYEILDAQQLLEDTLGND